MARDPGGEAGPPPEPQALSQRLARSCVQNLQWAAAKTPTTLLSLSFGSRYIWTFLDGLSGHLSCFSSAG